MIEPSQGPSTSEAPPMNTTPITPFPTPVIRFEVAVPSAARPVNKAAQALVETEALAEVRRAVNALVYG